MSIRVMTQVWKRGPETPTERLMMLAIADNADDDGLAWPSAQTLATKCCVDERSVKRIVRRLEEKGWLQVTRGGGHRNGYGIPNRYQINMSLLVEKPPKSLGDPVSPTPQVWVTLTPPWVTLSTTLGDPSVTLTIKNHHVEPKERASANFGEVMDALEWANSIIEELVRVGFFDAEFAKGQHAEVEQMCRQFKDDPDSGPEILDRCKRFWDQIQEHGVGVAE